jgi:hypothetical protein
MVTSGGSILQTFLALIIVKLQAPIEENQMGKAVDRVDEEFSVFDVTVSARPHAREF